MKAAQQNRMETARNLWVATVRRDGRPHLTPVWFVMAEGDVWICISSSSVKARNLGENPQVSCALEDGNAPIIAEGAARIVDRPWPSSVQEKFKLKYDWDIDVDKEYDMLVRVQIEKWLAWGEA